MVDVVQRVLAVAIALRNEPRGDIADHQITRLAPLASDVHGSGFIKFRERHTLRNDVVRLVEAELLKASRSPLGCDDVRGDVRPTELINLPRYETGIVDVDHHRSAEEPNLLEV